MLIPVFLAAGSLLTALIFAGQQSYEFDSASKFKADKFTVRNHMELLLMVSNQSVFKVTLEASSISIYSKNKRLLFANETQGFMGCATGIPSFEVNDGFVQGLDQHSQSCRSQLLQSIRLTEESLELTGSFLDCNSLFSLRLQQVNGIIGLKADCSAGNRIYLNFGQTEDQRFFGLGVQHSHPLLRNLPYSVLVRQKGLTRGDQPYHSLVGLLGNKGGFYFCSYYPAPVWHSSENVSYGSNLTNYLAWHSNQLIIHGITYTLYLFVDSLEQNLLSLEKALIGQRKGLPGWAGQGAIMGVPLQKVIGVVDFLKQGEIAGVWIQDWIDGPSVRRGLRRVSSNWQIDPKRKQLWDQVQRHLNEKGIKTVINFSPVVISEGQLGREMLLKGFFVRDQTQNLFKALSVGESSALLVDLFNKQAALFYKQIIKEAIRQTQASGLVVDLGQGYPVFSLERHNQYIVLWQQIVAEAVQQAALNPQQFLTISRSGFIASPKYIGAASAGDQLMSFANNSGLKSCLNAMISAPNSGQLYMHCEIGGSISHESLPSRSQVLMRRSMALSAYSSLFRTTQGLRPNHQIQVQDLPRQFAVYSRIFAALRWYRQMTPGAHVTPLWWHFEKAFVEDQFMLGKQLMIAPLLSEGEQRYVYFPADVTWQQIFNQNTIKGCNCLYIQQSKGFQDLVYIRADSRLKQRLRESLLQALMIEQS